MIPTTVAMVAQAIHDLRAHHRVKTHNTARTSTATLEAFVSNPFAQSRQFGKTYNGNQTCADE